jgi:hypothetical protein
MNSERKTFTDSSIQTNTEISSNKQLFWKVFFTIICIINSLIGVTLDKKSIFHPNNKFNHNELLKYFIYGYTYIIITSLVIALGLSIIIYITYKLVQLSRKIKPDKENKDETNKQSIQVTNSNTDTSFSEEDYNIINYSFVIFIFSFILLYTLAIPSGSYLLYHMLKNTVLKDYKRFFFLYLFITNNVILGIFILSFFMYIMFFIHLKISNRQKVMLDEEFINNIEKEIEKTNKISGTMPYIVENNSIRLNTLKKKQDTSQINNSNSNTGLNASGNNYLSEKI